MGKQEKEIFRNELAARQQVISEKKLPVIVILEGWGASGKGSAIGSIIKYMDPRFFRVYNMDVISEDEKRRPFLYRHALRMPKNGQFSFFDGGVMDELTKAYLHKEIDKEEYEKRVREAESEERR